MEKMNFDKMVGHNINRITHDLILYHNKRLEKHELTASQLRVLFCLWQKEFKSINQTEILEFLGIKPSSMTKLIKQLEQKGFIRKEVDPCDARNKLISLTTKGEELREIAYDIAMEIEEKLVKGFSEEEVETLSKLLFKLKCNLDEL